MSDEMLEVGQEILGREKVRNYNQTLVSSVLQDGILGGRDVRATGSVTQSVSNVMRNEISAVVVPVDYDIRNADRDGAIKIQADDAKIPIAIGHIPKDNPTVLGILADTILNGNAAGLLPVATERPWERFDQQRFFHSREVWEERLGDNFIVAVPLNLLRQEINLIPMNYFEGRFIAPFKPEIFTQIFVPEQHADLFRGVDPRIVTTVPTEPQVLEMNFCDSLDDRKKLEKREFRAPSYVNAIYKFMQENPGRYVLHIVRLASLSDHEYIKDDQKEPEPLSSAQLAKVGQNRTAYLDSVEARKAMPPDIDPLDDTDPLRLEVKRVLKQINDENPMPSISTEEMLDAIDGKDNEARKLIDTRIRRIDSLTALGIRRLLPALFPQLGLQLVDYARGAKFNELPAYGVNGTLPLGSHVHSVTSNLERYIKSNVRDLLASTENSFQFDNLNDVQDYYDEMGISSMISTLRFLNRISRIDLYKYQIEELEKLIFMSGVELVLSEFKGVHVSSQRFNQTSPTVYNLESTVYFGEMSPQESLDYCIKILEKLKAVYGEDSNIYKNNLALFQAKNEVKIRAAILEGYTGTMKDYAKKV